MYQLSTYEKLGSKNRHLFFHIDSACKDVISKMCICMCVRALIEYDFAIMNNTPDF